jgi:hypothetical protein
MVPDDDDDDDDSSSSDDDDDDHDESKLFDAEVDTITTRRDRVVEAARAYFELVLHHSRDPCDPDVLLRALRQSTGLGGLSETELQLALVPETVGFDAWLVGTAIGAGMMGFSLLLGDDPQQQQRQRRDLPKRKDKLADWLNEQCAARLPPFTLAEFHVDTGLPIPTIVAPPLFTYTHGPARLVGSTSAAVVGCFARGLLRSIRVELYHRNRSAATLHVHKVALLYEDPYLTHLPMTMRKRVARATSSLARACGLECTVVNPNEGDETAFEFALAEWRSPDVAGKAHWEHLVRSAAKAKRQHSPAAAAARTRQRTSDA